MFGAKGKAPPNHQRGLAKPEGLPMNDCYQKGKPVMNSLQQQLIPIIDHEGRDAVNLRDLHTFLEVTTQFKDWAPRMFAYGFTEGQDYVPLVLKNEQQTRGGHNRRDWAVTLDMAKELSMIQRTERGKQARQYFIEVEKQARNTLRIPQTYAEALRAHADEIEAHAATQAVVRELSPKAAAWESVVSSAGSWSYNDAAKVLCDEGEIRIGEKRLVNELITWGHLYRDRKGRPHVYQRFLEQGLYVAKARTYRDHITGEIKESSAPQVRITGRCTTSWISSTACA